MGSTARRPIRSASRRLTAVSRVLERVDVDLDQPRLLEQRQQPGRVDAAQPRDLVLGGLGALDGAGAGRAGGEEEVAEGVGAAPFRRAERAQLRDHRCSRTSSVADAHHHAARGATAG